MIARVLAFAALALAPLVAHAQAPLFRAYLSVNGNDANACTLPAPCRLLPAALAAVADGGEIWMLDSANYNTGTVAVTKSVSILAVPGALGSVVANGADALTVSGSGLKVSLKNLVFAPVAGAAPVGGGVISTGNVSLTIEGCTFARLRGIGLQVASGTRVQVTRSSFRDGGSHGIRVGDGSSASIEHTSLDANDTGILVHAIQAAAPARASIRGSTITGHFIGIETSTDGAGAVASVGVEDTAISSNSIGIATQVLAGGGTATTKAVRNLVVGNSITGLGAFGAGAKATASANTFSGNGKAFENGGGVLESAVNNVIRDNTNANTGTITNIALQ